MTLIIISFLVPIIGLIIYAVNVGKDKHITKCALKGLKMYLKFLVGQLIISVIVVLLMVIVFSANIGHHTSSKVNSNTATKELNTQEIVSKIQTNSYVSSADIKVIGKIIYITITFIENTTESNAKYVAKNTLDYFDSSYIEKYDFNFSLMSNDKSFEIIGAKNKSNNIIWNN